MIAIENQLFMSLIKLAYYSNPISMKQLIIVKIKDYKILVAAYLLPQTSCLVTTKKQRQAEFHSGWCRVGPSRD
jgi:hypothetical protein